MEEFVLKAKHYQIFLSLSIPSLIAGFVPNFDPTIQLVKIIFVGLAFTVWIFTLGRALNNCIPTRHQLSETFLIINFFAFAIIFALIAILLDYQLRFFGWAVLIPLYMLFSFVYLYYFASKALTTAEKRKRTSFGEHVGEMILLMTGYVGIWFIQPRINQIYEQNKSKILLEDTENIS
ncbi:MAG: hypothetical protein RIF36_21795 [Imperialibacter sp.]|uniref:hypothetical protein n=1 Tax=Imperialibacter sp. TaxID=2038411 RepID=UPI0032EF5F40